jgi:hypothetical protein
MTSLSIVDAQDVKHMRPVTKHEARLKLCLCGLGSLVGACLSLPASAADSVTNQGDDEKPPISLGLAPGTPQVGTLPGGLTPAYGQHPADETEWRFDFHGFMTMPLRFGINKRAGVVTTDQRLLVLHAPPVVPDYMDSFTYTSIVPQPYGQLNFSYGNSVVTGNVFIIARTASTAESYIDPTAEAGISDAFLTFHLPDLIKRSHFEINVGVFTNRYGIMGEYDEGRYGTPVIAQTNGAGENVVAQFAFHRWLFDIEQGFQGQLDKPPDGILPDGWNGFADPNTGSGFVNHVHAGIGYRGIATLGLHYMTAWTQDDRASEGSTPDGTIRMLGADLRLSMNHFGHLYLVAGQTHAVDSVSVGGIVQVLNASGGPGLMSSYFGPNSGGNGDLLTLAGQYDLSIGKLLRYPYRFDGKAPDIVVSLFGMFTRVSGTPDANYDNVSKKKYGMEIGYGMLPWLASSLRLDRVEPNSRDGTQSFSVVSPRLIFRSAWQAHDQVVLQYSHWFNGSGVQVRDGYPPAYDPTLHPDEDMISLSASMWW